jgi:single-strand DNA-binding protein
MNAIHFVGNLTGDPKLVEGASGKPRAQFTVAVNEGQGDDEKTHFVNVTAFGTLGENLAKSLTKGQRVVVIGRLNTYKKEVEIDNEVKNLTMVNFTASSVGPDLRWARATVTKVSTDRSEPPVDDEGNGEAEDEEFTKSSAKPSRSSAKSAPKSADDEEAEEDF